MTTPSVPDFSLAATAEAPLAVVSEVAEVQELQPHVVVFLESVGSWLAGESPRRRAILWLQETVGRLATLPIPATEAVVALSEEVTPIELPAAGTTAPIPSELTTLPTAAEPVADVVPPTADGIWTAPEVLLFQLERLTQYPHCEAWAIDTLVSIRSLIEGDRRERGQTAAILESLSHSADEAERLAETAPEEQLRVELLRARWGLMRRLAYWTAMRDMRLAAISETRIASRGELGPLFREVDWSGARRNVESLSAEIEAYERSRDPRIGRHVAQAERELRSTGRDLDHVLADAVEENYRNANLRIAITADILNRFISESRSESRPVRDRIAGTPVRGHSQTVSRGRVVLKPAVGCWQFDVLTDGVVESDTSSIGRARVRTHGSTQFSAVTPIVIGADGTVFYQETAVEADNCNHLVGVSTGLDWLPLIGALARSQAVQQYKAKQPRARTEVERKVAVQARDRINSRTGGLLADVRQDVKNRFTTPLAKYGVELTPLEVTTTEERLVARLRIAGAEQLAGHTPRPRALSDSLVSVQLHESALTNSAVALELNGERLSGSQLQARLREKLPRFAAESAHESSDDIVFQFAPVDAVRFRIDGGRLELSLAISSIVHENQQIHNFIVHAQFVPFANGMTAELVRDGPLGIEGRLGAADRARLQNVFNVVLAEDRRLPVFRPEDPADPRLAGLMITQLVLEDGWLGVSIGPAREGRVAQRQRSLY
jgi:hypothetical protein